MKNLKNLFFSNLLIIFFISASFSSAEIKINSMKDKLPMNSDVKIGYLSNGIKYYIKKNSKPEKRAELKIAFNAGSILEDDDQQGLAHFVEHMCFNGTKNYPKNDLINFLELTGVRFGADLNAYTSFDETVYMLQLPTDKPELLDKGIDILEEWAHEVSMEDTEIDKERGVIMEEWRLGKGAQDRIQKQQFPILLHNSKYANRLPIGDTNVLRNFKYETLRKFYREWYRTDLMAVIAVGDFDVAEVEKLIKKHFEPIPRLENAKKREEFTVPFHKEILVSLASDKELTMPMAQIYFKSKEAERGTYEEYRNNIRNGMIANMLSNRYQELTKKPNPPFLFAGGGYSSFIGDASAFAVVSALKSDDMMKGYNALLTELFRAYQNGFTKTELERTKKEMLRAMESNVKEKDKTESTDLAAEMARNFTRGESMPGIEYEYELYKKFIPEITIEELNALMKSYISKENIVISLATPEKEGIKIPTENELLSAFNEAFDKKLEAYKDVVPDGKLVKKLPPAGKITFTKDFKDLGVTEMTLSNGAKVVLKSTDFKNDEIQISGFSKGGTSLASDEDFISASLASSIINQSGLGSMDETKLEKSLSGKLARVNSSIGGLYENVSGSCSTQDMLTMFELLYLRFTAPRMDMDAFKSFTEKMKSQLETQNNSPRAVFNDTVATILSGYHFRSNPITQESLAKVDLNKVYSFYKERFAEPGDFTFFIVGNFKLDSIKPFIEQYIASIPTKNRVENWKDVGITTPNGKIDKKVFKGIEKQSSVRIAINGDYQYNRQNNFTIQALMEVFSIRLREVLREDKGGVYGVGAYSRPTKYPNEKYTINVMFGCNPDRVDELTTAVKDIINELKSKALDEVYLNKFKEIATRERETSLKENDFWLGSLSAYYQNGDDINLITQKDKLINAITPEDIHKAANKYFNMENYKQFVLFPEK